MIQPRRHCLSANDHFLITSPAMAAYGISGSCLNENKEINGFISPKTLEKTNGLSLAYMWISRKTSTFGAYGAISGSFPKSLTLSNPGFSGNR